MNGLRLRIYVEHELMIERELRRALTIGRSQDNDVTLDDEAVSAHHARIEPGAEGWRFLDAGSANGSQVAGGRALSAGESVVVEELTQFLLGSTVVELEPTDAFEAEATEELPSAGSRLVVLGGPEPRVHELRGAQVVVGRAEDCDVRLDVASVSQRHAELRSTPRGWVLRDLGSTNGSRVGVVPVSGERLLRSGSHLILGEADLYFVEGDAVGEGGEFAEWLAKKRQLKGKQAKAALEEAKATGRSLDEVLLSSGAVGPGKLTELRRQAEAEAERASDGSEGMSARLWLLVTAVVTFGLLAWLAWG